LYLYPDLPDIYGNNRMALFHVPSLQLGCQRHRQKGERKATIRLISNQPDSPTKGPFSLASLACTTAPRGLPG